MSDTALQKAVDITDEQINRLRDLHGDWDADREVFVPTAVPLAVLLRLLVIDTVGE
jgi:hypothetical protein